jgi:hypothetical protein
VSKIIYKEKGTNRILDEKRFRPQTPLPARHDYIHIGNAKWCVDCREFSEKSSFDGPMLTVIVWVYDDTKLH